MQVSASAQEQLSPTSRSFFSPTNQFFVILITCTVIRGGPRVFHTKTFSSSAFRQSPDILSWKNKFCKPTVFFSFVTMPALLLPWAHCFEIWPLHDIKTSRLRPVCKGLNVKIWLSRSIVLRTHPSTSLCHKKYFY